MRRDVGVARKEREPLVTEQSPLHPGQSSCHYPGDDDPIKGEVIGCGDSPDHAKTNFDNGVDIRTEVQHHIQKNIGGIWEIWG